MFSNIIFIAPIDRSMYLSNLLLYDTKLYLGYWQEFDLFRFLPTQIDFLQYKPLHKQFE